MCYSDRIRSAMGYTVLALGGAFGLINGVMSSTVIKTAESFAKYCPNHGEPVPTPFGIMTCPPLANLVDAQEVLVPLLNWAVPVVVGVGAALLAYNRYTIGSTSTCCERRRVIQIDDV